MQANVTNSDFLYNWFQPLSSVTRISSPLMTWSTHLMGRESLCCYMLTLQNINLTFRAVLNSSLKIYMGRFEPHSWQQLQVSAKLRSEMDCQIVCQDPMPVVGPAYIFMLACTQFTHCNFLLPMIHEWMKHNILYFSDHKTHRTIRRTMIFSFDFLEKNNDECILILVIYWKKTGLVHTKISNHNLIYSS